MNKIQSGDFSSGFDYWDSMGVNIAHFSDSVAVKRRLMQKTKQGEY